MKRQTDFVFGGTTVPAGTRATIDLPMAKLYTHSEVSLPVHVLHGKQHGPTLFVSASVHGDEINGVEIICRLLQSKTLVKMKGTLLAVPIVNPFGFIQRSRYLPDRRDLNHSFPGSPKGSLASRIAHLFMEEIVSRSDYGIDLHTGSNFRTNIPQIRTDTKIKDNLDLAKTFGAPMIIHSETRDGSLREAVSDKGVPVLLYEAGEALYFNETAIRTGVRGIIKVMRSIGMLPKLKARSEQESIVSHKTSWIRASNSGVFYKKVKLGDLIHKGGSLGHISDPLSDDGLSITAPFTGVVIGLLTLPLVHEGDALVNLARISDPEEAEDLLDDFTSVLTEEDYALDH